MTKSTKALTSAPAFVDAVRSLSLEDLNDGWIINDTVHCHWRWHSCARNLPASVLFFNFITCRWSYRTSRSLIFWMDGTALSFKVSNCKIWLKQVVHWGHYIRCWSWCMAGSVSAREWMRLDNPGTEEAWFRMKYSDLLRGTAWLSRALRLRNVAFQKWNMRKLCCPSISVTRVQQSIHFCHGLYTDLFRFGLYRAAFIHIYPTLIRKPQIRLL